MLTIPHRLQNVLEFEPYIAEILRTFLGQWDKHCEQARKISPDGWWTVDILPWLNFLAFDVIGDLAFGAPFGMVEKEADMAPIELQNGSFIYVPAVTILNERGEYSNCLGVMQPWLRPYARVCRSHITRTHNVEVLIRIDIAIVYRSLVRSWIYICSKSRGNGPCTCQRTLEKWSRR